MDLILEFLGAVLLIIGTLVVFCFAALGFKQWHESLNEDQDAPATRRDKFHKVTNIS